MKIQLTSETVEDQAEAFALSKGVLGFAKKHGEPMRHCDALIQTIWVAVS